MKGTRHREEQIIAILKQGEAGLTKAELCREHGISEQTYYRWKAKYGGMESGDAKKLKQLEDENRKLKARGGGADACLYTVCPSPDEALSLVQGGIPTKSASGAVPAVGS